METIADVRLYGETRHMDIIMYVLYSNDERFIQVMTIEHSHMKRFDDIRPP